MKKLFRFLLTLILLAAIAVFGARPLYPLVRELRSGPLGQALAERSVQSYADKRHISFEEYPQYLLDLYASNPETKDFVFNYPFREEDPVIDLSGYPAGEVPLFLQWDPMWGYEPYGGTCVAVSGCGPTCLAMAGYYLTGDEAMTPGAIAAFSEENGYYEPGCGSSWTLISEGAGKLGLTAQELPLMESKLVSAVESGKPVILSLRPGDFTTTGHYIVLTGVEDGAFRVNDPNSRERSEKLWSYGELEGQIRNIWAISK